MLTVPPLIVAERIVGSASEFLQPTMNHAMSSEHGPLDIALVALGVVVVIVTTIYSLLYLIRPGETGKDHIKRRILRDGTRGFR